jgi:hypothetical protein
MSAYKIEQKRLVHRGREFHCVSYEGVLANPSKSVPAAPAGWYLMQSGKRISVMPQVLDQSPEAVDESLIKWLDRNVFA